MFVLAFAGCVKDTGVNPRQKFTNNRESINKVKEGQIKGGPVFIINRGQPNSENSSLSVYDPMTKSINNSAFIKANGAVLGDLPESMIIFEGKGYIVVSNSQKVEVVDPNNLYSLGSISGLNFPSSFIGINSSKAYVSDLQDDSISVIDLDSLTIFGKIPLRGRIVRMAIKDNFVYAVNRDYDRLYKIHSILNQVIDSLDVGKTPNSIVFDANDKLWVLSGGGKSQENPVLQRIDPELFIIEFTITFGDITRNPGHLTINTTLDTLYFLDGGLFRVPVTVSAIPLNPIVVENNHLFSTAGIHPDNRHIYIADTSKFPNGFVFIHHPGTLELIDSFEVWINPVGLEFLKN